ncbi:hypothetical protein [Oleidesulfovibrio sp.]|uniref:hypothetical protein n=1 Tax=Oleidesulfovibrio sp. TaxID=2909707 RepID=UPI003A883E47
MNTRQPRFLAAEELTFLLENTCMQINKTTAHLENNEAVLNSVVPVKTVVLTTVIVTSAIAAVLISTPLALFSGAVVAGLLLAERKRLTCKAVSTKAFGLNVRALNFLCRSFFELVALSSLFQRHQAQFCPASVQPMLK